MIFEPSAEKFADYLKSVEFIFKPCSNFPGRDFKPLLLGRLKKVCRRRKTLNIVKNN
jgi:hypothetical protein